MADVKHVAIYKLVVVNFLHSIKTHLPVVYYHVSEEILIR